MSDYKLVPFEPTQEMIEAAEEAHMPFGDMDLALRMAILAAPAVQGEPGVKWAPEEVANGNKGIRWVSDEGVHGRPTDHDCRVYLESNPNARGCHCPECTMLAAAPAVQGEPMALPPFTTKIIEKLRRFDVCAEDGQDVDIGRHWLDMLVQLGLLNRVQRSPALWEMAQQGEDVLEGYAAPQPVEQHPAPDVAGVVDALETALFGTPLDDVPNRDNDDIWCLCYPHLPERASDALRDHLARIETALTAYRKGGDES